MKILVTEFIMAGGMAGTPLAAGIAQEGQMMLESIISDLNELSEIDEIICCLDQAYSLNIQSEKLCIYPADDDFYAGFRRLCRGVDAVLPIAPEADQCLQQLCCIVEEEGKLLFASCTESIKLCSSKIATAAYLAERNIPTLETLRLEQPMSIQAILPNSLNGWIVKPDQGLGCDSVWLCYSNQEVATAAALCVEPIVQAKVNGLAASISMLCLNGECQIIGYNQQIIEEQNRRYFYRGTRVNALLEYRAAFDQLAAQVAAALPGLHGYIGLDLIVQDQSLYLVEINPRLTTSYVGLYASIKINPAALLFELMTKNKLININVDSSKVITVDNGE